MRAFFIFLLVGFLTLPLSAAAQDCTQASSSADVMRCLTQQHERLQDELNKSFDQLSAQNNGGSLTQVKEVQGRWLQYRDLECQQQSAGMETQSLKRLEKLRCLNRLTEERVEALHTSLQNEERATLGEAGAPPRWMNALAGDYPNTFWRYGSRVVGDLDCDDADEHVVEGVRIHTKTGNIVPVIAVSENPSVGRPESAILVREKILQEGEEAQEQVMCDFVNEIQFSQDPEPEVSEAAETPEFSICRSYVSLQSQICGEQRLSWDGQAYVIR